MQRRSALVVLVAGLAFAAGWGLRGACTLAPAAPGSSVGPADSIAAGVEPHPRSTPGPAAPDTARVTPDEAAVARPDAVPGARVAPSGLVIPVAGVRAADLVDTFTAARSEGRSHDAIDILAPRGTPVRAAAAGRVLRLFTSDRGGITVYVLGNDNRTVYYYAHLDRYARGLAADRRLARGETLGYVGDTGNAAPGNTHLHFAIWTVSDPANFWDGSSINPYPVLGGR
ncbi:MAG TPA: peptidoglycan DD-metalloendopeptidase family protein [Rhodothermales bacterium]|nr:peptidoglycan DD-metalloendopeptidase family protein [Rhodothermales bacterium]